METTEERGWPYVGDRVEGGMSGGGQTTGIQLPVRRLISVTAVQGERLALSRKKTIVQRVGKRLQVAGGAGACLRSRTIYHHVASRIFGGCHLSVLRLGALTPVRWRLMSSDLPLFMTRVVPFTSEGSPGKQPDVLLRAMTGGLTFLTPLVGCEVI